MHCAVWGKPFARCHLPCILNGIVTQLNAQIHADMSRFGGPYDRVCRASGTVDSNVAGKGGEGRHICLNFFTLGKDPKGWVLSPMIRAVGEGRKAECIVCR